MCLGPEPDGQEAADQPHCRLCMAAQLTHREARVAFGKRGEDQKLVRRMDIDRRATGKILSLIHI